MLVANPRSFRQHLANLRSALKDESFAAALLEQKNVPHPPDMKALQPLILNIPHCDILEYIGVFDIRVDGRFNIRGRGLGQPNVLRKGQARLVLEERAVPADGHSNCLRGPGV